MADPDTVIDRFFGDPTTPIEWANEEEKKLHFWLDDLHCPQPISPMYFDIGGWWLTCDYMFRRFGVPFGRDWVAKNIEGYVHSAVVPRDPGEASKLGAYYNMVMPVYADKFLGWWNRRYLPEIQRNFEYLDSFPAAGSSLPELMILLEDAIEIQERHFRLHWMLNLAQFQSSLNFGSVLAKIVGDGHEELAGRILVSDEDRNWDSIRELWKLKEVARQSQAITAAFGEAGADSVLAALAQSAEGRDFLSQLDAYKDEYGHKSMWAHEYIYPTWRENPTPIIEAIRGYLASGYDYEQDVRQLRESRDAAIRDMWAMVPADAPQAGKESLQAALDLALKMAPLTPDHHFYMDQGTYARVRMVLMQVGRKLVEHGVFREPDDVMFLRYDELRAISADPAAVDSGALIAERRRARQEAYKVRPRLWAGTITHWSLYEEPYKQSMGGWPGIYERSKAAARQPSGTLRGLGASAGVVEGVARVVDSAEQFDQVQEGELLVCRMTSPAWVVLFTKIGGLVTDSGGALSHPAVVSREFGIPAVVGTRVATQMIKSGQRVRVDGGAGVVEILS
jgi:pyruvate,water dikinase